MKNWTLGEKVMRSRAVAYHIQRENLNRALLLFPLRQFAKQTDLDDALAGLKLEIKELEHKYENLIE